MSRRVNYIIYVDKAIMTKPAELVDAVLAYFIKKELDIRERKLFLALFMKAPTDERKMKVIDEWVQVRDAATFPFRKATEALASTGITTAEAADALTPEEEQEPVACLEYLDEEERDAGPSCRRTSRGIEGTANVTFGKEQYADTEAEGGVPVDDGADEEPESRDTSD